MIQVSHIAKSFEGRTLFSDLSFSLSKGINLIEGKSGCGKTTLINILMGMEKPDAGKVLYGKKDLKISYAGQDETLFSDLSLNQNIQEMRLDVDQKVFDELVDILYFDYQDKPINQLSGGERQKAEIILCLSKPADVYILDEPFSSLDEEAKNSVVEVLNKVAENHYILLVNHDTSLENLKIAQRISLHSDNKTCETIYDVNGTFAGNHSKISLSIKAYFKKQFFFVFLKTTLLVLSLVFFALGLSFMNLKSSKDLLKVFLNHDPFSVHSIRTIGDEEEIISSGFMSYADTNGVQYLTMVDGNTYDAVMFFGSLKTDDNQIYSYSPMKQSIINHDQKLSINHVDYELKIITKDECDALLPRKSKLMQSIMDGYISRTLILCNNKLIDDIMLTEGISIEFSVDNVNLTRSGFHFNAFSKQEMSMVSDRPDASNNVIEDTDEYLLAIPGVTPGQEVKDKNEKKHKVTHAFDDGKIHVSLPLWKLIEISSSLYSENYRSFGFEFYDEDIIEANEKLGFIYCYDIYEYYGTVYGAYPYLFLPLSVICLFADFFFVFFVNRTKNKWYQKTKSVFQRNGLSAKSLNLGILLVDGIGVLLGIILSVFLYIFAFIPQANEYVMKLHLTPPVGYYYYSQQPKNPYYDSINKPMELITFEPVFIVAIVLCIVMLLITFYLTTRKQEKVK